MRKWFPPPFDSGPSGREAEKAGLLGALAPMRSALVEVETVTYRNAPPLSTAGAIQ